MTERNPIRPAKQGSPKPVGKKVYTTPKLVVYGDLGTFTRTSSQMGTVSDAGGGMKTS